MEEASLLGERRRVKLARSLCKGCSYCIEFCPRRVFEPGEDSGRGVSLPRITRPEACTLCGLCTRLCPDLALTITDEEEDVGG